MQSVIKITKEAADGSTSLLAEGPLTLAIPSEQFPALRAYAQLHHVSNRIEPVLVLSVFAGSVAIMPGEKLILEVYDA